MQDRVSDPGATFSRRHPTLVILIHWLTAALILAGIVLEFTHEDTGARQLKRLRLEQHRYVGLIVLGLVALRLLARLWQRRRLVKHDLPWLINLVSTLGHWGLYALMIITPLLGWALTNAHGQDVTLFGLVQLPALVGADEDLVDTLGDWHELSAWTLVGLVCLHALAALWHHFVRRDGVLHAMLPLASHPDSDSDSDNPA